MTQWRKADSLPSQQSQSRRPRSHGSKPQRVEWDSQFLEEVNEHQIVRDLVEIRLGDRARLLTTPDDHQRTQE